MKRFNRYILFLVLAQLTLSALGQDRDFVKGRVVSEKNQPLPGATVILKGTAKHAVTDSSGRFEISFSGKDSILIFSYVGYSNREITVNKYTPPFLIVALSPSSMALNEVIVSTGYQQIPKERATGSFVQLDNNLLNRRVSPDIISRLEDVTSGLIFNRDASLGNSGVNISIRGQSTIFANTQPLIVVDNFPFNGDINDLNPNDVESVTVLKDAAAASIWGSRAGNGVIVVTTKKGRYQRGNQVSFNANTTIGAKPNLFYQPQISSSEFIDIERNLFSQGYYTDAEQSANHQALTPVVQLLFDAQNGQISQADADAQINALRNHDVRSDLSKYFYRNSVNQQYNLNLNGGTDDQRYFVSGGYDHNLSNLVGNAYDRVTLNANNTYAWFKHRLEFTTGAYISQSKATNDNPGYTGNYQSSVKTTPYYPYASLSDTHGNPLAVARDYQGSFISASMQQGLLDWSYSPLEELRIADNYSKTNEYRLNGNLAYKFGFGLSAHLYYQYDRYETNANDLQSKDSYFARNLINQFTSVDGSGNITRPIPLGGILDITGQTLVSQNARAQLNYDRSWQKNTFNAIAGYEISDAHTIGSSTRFYGYDPEHASSQPVDYISQFPRYDNPGATSQIPDPDLLADLTDRYLSYYGNFAYSYDARFTLSGSARMDESNLFGVKTNQKGVPLWSAGLAWNLSNESFYKVNWLPYLKVRLTYGYNGNVYKNVSAYTTANYFSNAPSTNLPYATIMNPPDPELKWERIKVYNSGLDFSTKNARISGTIEYYGKQGLDLIGTTPFAPSTGITVFTGNNASTITHGFDLTLASRNIEGQFKWNSNLLLSHVTDKVTRYNESPQTLPGIGTPVLGRPLFSIYSYKWAGLDPQTGSPQGYVNGAVSQDYGSILASAAQGNYIYNGPARPTYFGALRNTFSYKNVSLSFNITYRFHYFYQQNSVDYQGILTGQGGSSDYDLRWQQPGDERRSQVPSMPATIDVARDQFYLSGSELVKRADNIRLQDLSVAYEITPASQKGLPVRHVQLYLYGNNIGLLWKATKGRYDPDYATAAYTPPRTISVGLKADL